MIVVLTSKIPPVCARKDELSAPPTAVFAESVICIRATILEAVVRVNPQKMRIVLVALVGVIVTEIEASVKEVLVVALLVVSVARTTCNTFPPTGFHIAPS